MKKNRIGSLLIGIFAIFYAGASHAKSDQSESSAIHTAYHYDLVKNGMYGYTDADSGQVVFFRYSGVSNGKHQLLEVAGGTAMYIECEANCEFVDIYNGGRPQTFRPRDGSLLKAVIDDMRAGYLGGPEAANLAADAAPSGIPSFPSEQQQKCNLAIGIVSLATTWRDNGVPQNVAMNRMREALESNHAAASDYSAWYGEVQQVYRTKVSSQDVERRLRPRCH
ncbi:hypothetical protein [Burkholderia glumae]|uniref:hypothetical protein n=1 Tax=Burkholderia glumae TaxID=337 RepID=UPI0011D224DC|nr:hypothetical protein [Burkholderia glumae]